MWSRQRRRCQRNANVAAVFTSAGPEPDHGWLKLDPEHYLNLINSLITALTSPESSVSPINHLLI